MCICTVCTCVYAYVLYSGKAEGLVGSLANFTPLKHLARKSLANEYIIQMIILPNNTSGVGCKIGAAKN